MDFLSKMKKLQTIRQILVLSGLAFCSVSDGFIIGQMSGMLNALHSKNSTISLNDDDVSWIASTISITSFCGFALMAAITEVYGRRITVTILSIPVLICWLVMYYANDKTTLFASRVIVGISYGGLMLLTYINIGEYVSPNLRSFCLNMISCLGCNSGTMLGHILSIFLHWRYVALVGIIPTAISAVMPLFWVESPSWLATKSRFEECERAFKALHVPSEASDYELKILLEANRSKGREETKKINSLVNLMRKYLKESKQKYFWRIAMLLIVIDVYRVAAGRTLLNTLAIIMIQDISGGSYMVHYMLVVDGFGLIGLCLSCVLVRRFKMRSVLFISGMIANIIQIVLAVSLYIEIDSDDMAWIKIILLALYFISVTAGPYAVLKTLLAELHPLEIKALNTFCFGAICGVMQFLNIKFALKLFSSIGYHGVFFSHAIVIFMCLLYLYKYLPETKGRTLQEIEFYFRNNTFKCNLCLPDLDKEMKTLNEKNQVIEPNEEYKI